ncbi:MAG: hypothetical protein JNG88_13230 [Phycisphaerales bacterium]|nr:hypothetical protein [Phycisphaerales bacterium]
MRFDRAAVTQLLTNIERIIATRGPAVRDLTIQPASIVDALKLLIGPTGNLRAPALRIGRTLVVGFSDPLYDEHVAKRKARRSVGV